jgi:hypothetical protein
MNLLLKPEAYNANKIYLPMDRESRKTLKLKSANR